MPAELPWPLLLLIGLACAGAALLLTGRLRLWLQRAAVLDRPNARSMHAQPTPRGAGIGVAAVVLAAQALLLAGGQLPVGTGLALMLGGLGHAMLGWSDDRQSLSIRVRLLLQLVLACGYVGALMLLASPAVPAGPTLALGAVRALALVWLVNVFNFMDGADALAGSQTVLAALAGSLSMVALGHAGTAAVGLAVAGAAAGFLRWNWPPAQIFMGDSGSYFLGFQFGALIVAAPFAAATTAVWLIVMAPFVIDASLTLARRLLTGAAFWRAHRTHAYQRLLLGGWQPAHLVRALLLWHVVVLWPCVWLASVLPQRASLALVLSYGLTAIMWLRSGGARRDG